ncbi:DUF4132 domain-containing protein [Actinomadura algeriensis]|uniref:DUF4132 domain-containing protein n=1 Tax=Actinomadura algeriensis TaxID=1679523 RepID=A0ABR9K3T8_9ACTN|nr:DUF4132 domain-containing protein [Actinomadura algeriensis]MBE1537269.1 hypothetical protein [Actinomadura algeriensis]
MTDENTLTMPGAWRRVLHPRRDRPPVPAPPAPDKGAAARVAGLIEEKRDELEKVLDFSGTDPELAEAARAHLRGEANPRGAAALAHLTVAVHGLQYEGGDRLFADAWIAGHGIAFAVAAFAETGGIRAVYNVADLSGRGKSKKAQARGELNWTGVRPRRTSDAELDWWIDRGTARRLRAHLAAAPDDVYAGAVERLAEHRGHPLQKRITAYLVPTRADWVEEQCANPGPAAGHRSPDRWLLHCALGEPSQPAAIGLPFGHHDLTLDVYTTLVDGVGPEAALPLLLKVFEDEVLDDALVEVLATLPLDGAFRALAGRIDHPAVPPGLLAAAARFPARAVRLLAEADDPRLAELLAGHVRSHPDLTERTLPALSAQAREKVRPMLDAAARVPAATDLPPLLAEPPWTRARAKAEPVVLKDLPPPGIRAISWEPGEREAWRSRSTFLWDWSDRIDHVKLAAKFGKIPGHQQIVVVLKGDEDVVRPLLPGWEPPVTMEEDDWMRVLVARFEFDAHDIVLRTVRTDPAPLGGLLMPLLSDEVAWTMADWLVRLRTAGRTARAWFERHGTSAAPALIPDALGKPGTARRAAERALRFIAERHGPGAIVEAARVHGDEAAAGIEALLTADPLEDLPKKIPAVAWVDPRALPPLLLRGRAYALPDDAVRHVLTMLAMSGPYDVYAGVRTVRDLCDPASLGEFGWALFRWWEACGASAKENWAFTQLGLTGDDDTVRRLTPLIRAWPGEGGHARAVTGLDVLAAIGTDTALMHLHTIAQRVKFKGLKTRAQEKIAEVAAELDLTAEQLADRLVPDFGLDASGTLTLDYGPRRFVIAFDEQLKPTITDDGGKLRKSLPKPGAKDDPDLAPAAAKRFAALKKDVRTVAADQIFRLEQAMVTGRRWSLPEFRELLATHPLLGHLVRRLVWFAEDGAAFRVAEDGTFADAADDTITLPDTARIGVAHPLHLGDDVPAWSEMFADYEILQPFEQLGRRVHTLTADERTGSDLTRFEGAKVPSGAVLGLVNRGWERGAPQDAGVEAWISRRVAPDRHLVVRLDPGIPAGSPDLLGDQVLASVRLADSPGGYWSEGKPYLLGELDPVIASEVIADLTHLTGPADGASR